MNRWRQTLGGAIKPLGHGNAAMIKFDFDTRATSYGLYDFNEKVFTFLGEAKNVTVAKRRMKKLGY